MSPVTSFRSGGPQMDIRIDGIPGANSMLRDAAARGEDMRPAMAEVGLLFQEGHRRQFASHGGYLGTPWPENSEQTLERKGRSGIPALSGLMVEEGDLEQAAGGGQGGFLRARRSSVSVGIKLFEAIFAQAGASGARRGVEPARPILGINELERLTSVRMLTDFLLGR